ncbi:hypothetical protein SmJEL517_g02518 [Synchytrium microbalum]|uniref:Proteasome assembly chaperone 1 n=1 Tax=Synchytrium microbalum TaxID=1806994 RepID=A0A507CAH6_9FUNG|nr:uncharacterized protein SmJEL517_g02518 [Synchytrium microbalum]TPX35006.1 hypothetical protein SmJEL517_g02518 [Synchytrium microbalum]
MSQYFYPFEAENPTSRSYYEDEEEQTTLEQYQEESMWSSPVFRLSPLMKQAPKLSAELLLIGLPGSGALFLNAIFPQKMLVGLLLMPDASSSGNPFSSDMARPGTAVYREKSNPNILVAMCWNAVAPERAVSWAQCLSQNVDARRIVILDSLSASRYRPAEYETDQVSPPWLRQLSTTGSAKVDSIPTLEAPNMLTGMGAALLNKMEMKQHTATYCYSSLLEQAHGKDLASQESLVAYEPILKSFDIKCETSSKKYTSALNAYFTHFKDQFRTDKSIYL